MYGVFGVAVLLLVVLIMQIVNVRGLLKTYSKDDYYKQILVKNEYNTVQATSCSNIGIYGWQIDTILAGLLSNISAQINTTVKMPSFFYSVPTTSGIRTIEYSTSEIFYIPILSSSPATTRFVNDVLSNKIDYVTWSAGLFRPVYVPDFSQQMLPYLTKAKYNNIIQLLETNSVIALCKIPSMTLLKTMDFDLAQSTDVLSDTTLQSFLGDSRGNILDLPNSLHIIGYKL
jgi:hypothetical protein